MEHAKLSKTQQMIVDHLHTDFGKIPFLSDIAEAISIHSSTDWYWHYSDDGSVLRNGQERVEKSQTAMMNIALRTGDKTLMEFAKFNPAALQRDDPRHLFVETNWPWWFAYVYSQGKNRQLLVELSMAGSLNEYNHLVSTLVGQVTWLITNHINLVYNHTLLNNDVVDQIAEATGLQRNRIFSHLYDSKPVSVSGEMYTTASVIAQVCRKIAELGDLMRCKVPVPIYNESVDTLQGHAERLELDGSLKVCLGLHDIYINSKFSVTVLLVSLYGFKFYIPVKLNKG